MQTSYWLRALALTLLPLTLWSQQKPKPSSNQLSRNEVVVTLLQLNDVYEISPLDNGKSGGLARVSTLRKQLLKQNRNVYTLLAGDFLSPSAMGTLKDSLGRDILGRQMVDVLNRLPVDLVTFGNHEFDMKSLAMLNERIDSSKFEWINGNVLQADSKPFTKLEKGLRKPIPPVTLKYFTNGRDTLKIGFLGVTIGSTMKEYVKYTDVDESIQSSVRELKKRGADVIIALTHLARETDTMLAAKHPEISLFIGGHEHVNSLDTIRSNGRISYVTKADANARTVYIHTLKYNTKTKRVSVQSELRAIDEKLEADAQTNAVVERWNKWADSTWRRKGYNPCEVLADLTEPLDGTEHNVRFRPTNLTDLIAATIYDACSGDSVDASLFNSGSIRIDDSIKTRITQYDVIRTIPYGGRIDIAVMKGFLLKRLLNACISKGGNGCFLQYYNIEQWGNVWRIDNREVYDDSVYRVAMNNFLLTGGEQNMDFFKPGCPGLISVEQGPANSVRADLVKAVSGFIRKYYPKPSGNVDAGLQVPCY